MRPNLMQRSSLNFPQKTPQSTKKGSHDSVSEPSDTFPLKGVAFAAAKILVSTSAGVACAGPDVGTYAATDLQYHKKKPKTQQP
jgi:hypothetical protein